MGQNEAFRNRCRPVVHPYLGRPGSATEKLVSLRQQTVSATVAAMVNPLRVRQLNGRRAEGYASSGCDRVPILCSVGDAAWTA